MRYEALVKFMAALQEANDSERPPGGTSSIATWMSTSGGREESSAIGIVSLDGNGSAASVDTSDMMVPMVVLSGAQWCSSGDFAV